MQFPSDRKVAFVTPLAVAVSMLTLTEMAQGAGYGINENSASYMGTGFAGRASNPQDASIAANNPGGISFVEGPQISAGTAVILKGGEFEGQHTRPLAVRDDKVVAQGKTEDFQSTTPVPFGHFVVPVNEKLSVGVSGYGPYGIELEYDKDWAGKYFGIKTSVKVINLQGTVSYKLQDNFSVGIGLIGSYVKGELSQTSSGPLNIPGLLPVTGTIDGDANTFSWNIGALWQIDDMTMLGLAYHAPLEFTLEGDVKAESSVLNMESKAKLDITMPERAAISFTRHLDEKWTLMAEATWTRWSRFEEFYVKANDPSLSSYIPMNWTDVWSFSLGTSYQLNREWQLRAGYMRDQSPVDDKNRTVRSPDSDRNWFTAGLNWKPNKKVNIDLSYAYVKLDKGKISETKHKTPPEGGGTIASYGTLTGEYNNSSHIVAAQFNYIF